jgi:hypothetical protein
MEKLNEKSYANYLGDYLRHHRIGDFSKSGFFSDKSIPPGQSWYY